MLFKELLCTLTLVGTTYLAVQAQAGGRSLTAPTDLDYIGRQMNGGKGLKIPADTKGTPWLLPIWTQGRVLTPTGTIGPVWLKYNLASNELVWRRPAGDSLELETHQIKEFTLGDSLQGSQTTFRRYLASRIEDPNLRTAFFEVVYDAGHSGLLCYHTKVLSHTTSGSPSLNEATPPRWQNSIQYFLKRNDNVIVPVKLTQKNVLEALGPAQSTTLTAYAKQEHLSFKNEKDYAKLLAYYDAHQ